MTKIIPTGKAEAIEFHREELERLTGKMVTFRDRKKFMAAVAVNNKKRRDRIKQMQAEAAARHPEFCDCDECFARAESLIAARESAKADASPNFTMTPVPPKRRTA
jgi:hypothetical protein